MKYKQLRLGDLAEFTTGKLNANKAVEDGKYPFFTTSPETLRINNFAFDQDAILLGGNNANGVFQLKRYTGKFNAYQRTYVISVVKENIINNDYLYYALMPKLVELQNKSLGTATKFITKRILENLLIKVPNNYNEMERRATYLRTIDNKIQLNKQLNANLANRYQLKHLINKLFLIAFSLLFSFLFWNIFLNMGVIVMLKFLILSSLIFGIKRFPICFG
ncbi:restriction endonuclease subunit S [Limosilactobacillus reuteri]|uniref:restriction endonuclease subunit S n=1 Tax=Limosilactobacillus reuteri TaxID=1598 RepID=UPI001CDD79C0|nr:restriction endonuclease subunit S [Limosilactobacillus reuteri]